MSKCLPGSAESFGVLFLGSERRMGSKAGTCLHRVPQGACPCQPNAKSFQKMLRRLLLLEVHVAARCRAVYDQ